MELFAERHEDGRRRAEPQLELKRPQRSKVEVEVLIAAFCVEIFPAQGVPGLSEGLYILGGKTRIPAQPSRRLRRRRCIRVDARHGGAASDTRSASAPAAAPRRLRRGR